MKYTKQIVREIRKGIVKGELITEEQEEMIHHFGIGPADGILPGKAWLLQPKIDGILRKLSYKKRK